MLKNRICTSVFFIGYWMITQLKKCHQLKMKIGGIKEEGKFSWISLKVIRIIKIYLF